MIFRACSFASIESIIQEQGREFAGAIKISDGKVHKKYGCNALKVSLVRFSIYLPCSGPGPSGYPA